MKSIYQYQGELFSIELAPTGKTYRATFNGRTVSVEILHIEGARLDLLIDGLPTSAYVTRDGKKRWVTIKGQTLVLVESGQARKQAAPGLHPGDLLSAQMPGLVRAVMVANGDQVRKGQTLAVIEAMKMENKLVAPFDGTVKKLLIKIGQIVEREQILLELSAADSPTSEPNSNPDLT